MLGWVRLGRIRLGYVNKGQMRLGCVDQDMPDFLYYLRHIYDRRKCLPDGNCGYSEKDKHDKSEKNEEEDYDATVIFYEFESLRNPFLQKINLVYFIVII